MVFCSKKNLPNYLVNRSACHFMLEDYKSSLLDARKALQYDINYERAYEQIIDLYLRDYDLEAIEEVIHVLSSINLNNSYISGATTVCCYFKTIEKQIEEFGRLKDFKKAISAINSALKVADFIQHFILLKIKYTRKLEKQNEVRIFNIYLFFIEQSFINS